MKLMLIVLLITVITVPVAAQGGCGEGQPCEGVPWRIPVYPVLLTPTPMPTQVATVITLTPTPTGTYMTQTPTVAPTATALFGISPISDQVATLRAMINATQIIPNLDGMATEEPAAIEESAALFFGYVRGLGQFDIGFAQPLFDFMLLRLAIFLGVFVIVMTLPVLGTIWNLVRRIIQFLRMLLP